jgi:chromosome segregation ATPase
MTLQDAAMAAKSGNMDELARTSAQLAACRALLAQAKEEAAERGNAVEQMKAKLEAAEKRAAKVMPSPYHEP